MSFKEGKVKSPNKKPTQVLTIPTHNTMHNAFSHAKGNTLISVVVMHSILLFIFFAFGKHRPGERLIVHG